MMENRRLILWVALGFVAIVLYLRGVAWMDQHHPGALGTPPSTQPVEATAQSNPPSSAPTSQQVVATQESTGGAPTMTATTGGPARIVAATTQGAAAEQVSLGSANIEDPDYVMDLKLDPKGAGVRSVVLNRFQSAARNGDRYTFEEPPHRHEDLIPFASKSITVDKSTF